MSIKQVEKLKQDKKERKLETKNIFIRAPKSYHDDLNEISRLTGISVNAVCLELLRPAIKERLKELKK